MKINWKAFFISTIATFLAVVLMIGTSYFISDWNDWKQATSMPDNAFNEAIRAGYLRQPWNTFSSFAFLWVGVYIMALPFAKNKQKSIAIYNNKVLRLVYGITLIILGLGSAFLHISLTFIGQTTDVVGMYLLSVFVILYGRFRKSNISTNKFMIYYLLFNILLFIPLVFSPELRRYLFAITIVLGLIIEHFANRNNDYYESDMLFASAAIILIGFILWILDNSRLFFNPYSWFQGHVLWHVCGAISCWLLYVHYNHEK